MPGRPATLDKPGPKRGAATKPVTLAETRKALAAVPQQRRRTKDRPRNAADRIAELPAAARTCQAVRHAWDLNARGVFVAVEFYRSGPWRGRVKVGEERLTCMRGCGVTRVMGYLLQWGPDVHEVAWGPRYRYPNDRPYLLASRDGEVPVPRGTVNGLRVTSGFADLRG